MGKKRNHIPIYIIKGTTAFLLLFFYNLPLQLHIL